MGPVDEKADKAGKAEKAEKVEKASVEEGGAVLVPVTFPSGVTYQAVVRQFIGIGTMNVKTARGEVKAESTDIIMTFGMIPMIRRIRTTSTTSVLERRPSCSLSTSSWLCSRAPVSPREKSEPSHSALFRERFPTIRARSIRPFSRRSSLRKPTTPCPHDDLPSRPQDPHSRSRISVIASRS